MRDINHGIKNEEVATLLLARSRQGPCTTPERFHLISLSLRKSTRRSAENKRLLNRLSHRTLEDILVNAFNSIAQTRRRKTFKIGRCGIKIASNADAVVVDYFKNFSSSCCFFFAQSNRMIKLCTELTVLL